MISSSSFWTNRPPQEGSLLADPQHPDRVIVNIGGLPYIGVHDAPVTMIEFTDLQCPYCAFDAGTYRKIWHALVETGKVRFVHWDLPLAINPHALFAAQAARCAREQNRFWDMRDWMGDHPQQLDLEHVINQAILVLHLDAKPLRYCLATAQYKEAVEKEAAEAADVLHLTGVPAFVIGKTAAIVDGEVVIGALPYQAFEDKLNALLK
jgi:protein-disulfide isomerase